MGDAFGNTAWDLVLFCLVFVGVPALIVGIPLALIVGLAWRIERRLRARPDQVPPPTNKV